LRWSDECPRQDSNLLTRSILLQCITKACIGVAVGAPGPRRPGRQGRRFLLVARAGYQRRGSPCADRHSAAP